MGSKSVSTNQREEAIFKAEAFRELEKGKFIGFTSDCNEPIFRGKVMPVKVEPREISNVADLSEADLLENFTNIINSTKRTFQK